MGRRKKGKHINGWCIIDKPAGLTSTQVVNKTRWAFDAQKAGHAGTLDPDATGLLAVALGEATKIIPFVTDALKAYHFTVSFGQATTTDDASGEILKESDLRPSASQIQKELGSFIGHIQQVPPQFSAVKVAGERAYDLARDGEDFALKPRSLYVESLSLLSQNDANHADFELVCGKGGYVRSIARDLGEKLGCYGHVKTLRRLWSGPFDIGQAHGVDELEQMAKSPEILSLLTPLEDGLGDLPQVRCSNSVVPMVQNGNPVPALMSTQDTLSYGDACWLENGNKALALGHYRSGHFHPSRVFVYDPASS